MTDGSTYVLCGRLSHSEFCQLWNDAMRWKRTAKFTLPNLVEIKRIVKSLKSDISKPDSGVESKSCQLTYHWTAEMDEFCGSDSDDVIAAQLGRTKQAIRARRNFLGKIEKRTPWTAEDDSLLGTDSDTNIGMILNRPMQTVKARRIVLKTPPFESRWTDEMDALIGTDTNRNVAAKLGKTLDSVKHRARLLRARKETK